MEAKQGGSCGDLGRKIEALRSMLGRECLYKDRSSIRLAVITSVKADAQRTRVRAQSVHLLRPGSDASPLSLGGPTTEVRISAGWMVLPEYGNANFWIHHPRVKAYVVRMLQEGAPIDDLLRAFNSGRGLPAELASLRAKPFPLPRAKAGDVPLLEVSGAGARTLAGMLSRLPGRRGPCLAWTGLPPGQLVAAVGDAARTRRRSGPTSVQGVDIDMRMPRELALKRLQEIAGMRGWEFRQTRAVGARF